MRILTAEAMRQVDRAAMEELGIPSLVLMENAAIGVIDAVAERFPEAEEVGILCGPGNNGGDGLAVARHLANRGYRLHVVLVPGRGKLEGDAGKQLEICRQQGLDIGELTRQQDLSPLVLRLARCDLLIDALFGTGLGGPLQGLHADLVAEVNRLAVPRLAIDLPSGLNGSGWEIPGPHLTADVTVTFAALKMAHVFPPAVDAVGEVVVADLGIPPDLVEGAEGNLHLLVGEELQAYLLHRRPATHKGDYGHVLLVAGSQGKAGAAILAARAAVRAGAGLVTAAVPEAVLSTVDLGSLESMTLPVRCTASGGWSAEAAAEILTAAGDKQVLALGPGLGTQPSTVEGVRRVVLESQLPLVLDADGINAFAGEGKTLAKRRGTTVLTPHPGELGRLLGLATSEVVANRLEVARRAAAEVRGIVVLKGHQSLVATPEGAIFVNSTGNPGMASGGTGDVLTGLIAGLVGRGYDPVAGAQLGVYLHGLAGDLAAVQRGEEALTAGALLEALPRAFAELAASGP